MNFKNLAMWAIIIFLTIGLYNMFKQPQNISQKNNISFSEFLTEVDEGRVVKVDIKGNPQKIFIFLLFAILMTIFLIIPSIPQKSRLGVYRLLFLTKKIDYYCFSFLDFGKSTNIKYEDVPTLCDKFKIKKNLIKPLYLS